MSTDVIFSASSNLIVCANISVAQDGVVEDTEFFGAMLDYGSDEGVVLIDNNTTVFILDDDCKSKPYSL